jgi:hypothetical protein
MTHSCCLLSPGKAGIDTTNLTAVTLPGSERTDQAD